jgi:uncharacterized delta-60 repeat protein
VVAHLTTGGQLDASFGSGGIAAVGVGSTAAVFSVDGIAIDPTRGLVVAATTAPRTSATFDRPVVTRFDFQGSLDPSFNNGAVEFFDFQPPAQTDNHARAVAVQPDGKILLAGTTQKIAPGGVTLFALARLNPDGTRDFSFEFVGEALTGFFAPGSFTFIDIISHSVLVQPDGKIVVTGSAGNYFALARYLGVNSAPPVTPQPPLVGPISTPPQPVLIRTTVMVSASFTYNIPTDQHTAIWNWGDGMTSAGVVTEANGQGTVTGSHVFAVPGVYQVTVTVTDQRGASGSATAIPGVVVFIPILGVITGSGRIVSPPGAFARNPALSGKASFQLSARSTSTHGSAARGKFVLNFKAAGLSFRSTSVNWLVVSGNTAWYEGTGTINGAGSYNFLVSLASGGGRTGKLRIRIWNATTGAIVYDSQPGAPIGAAPTTPTSSGRITLHVKQKHR